MGKQGRNLSQSTPFLLSVDLLQMLCGSAGKLTGA
jgi:hypothetical protein